MMFLDSRISTVWRVSCFQVVKVVVLVLLQSTSSRATEPRLPCFLEVAVYDPRGTRLPFKITAVNPVGNTKINLLTDKRTKGQLSAKGDRLLFSDSVIRREVEITVSDTQRTSISIKKEITLWSCQQRLSVQHGVLDTGYDAACSLISGRVSGCSFTGDWWIRATPMFEGGSLTYEGYINPEKGSFQIAVGTRGGRHILVIGKDRSPVKVLAIDVVGAGTTDAGTLDLSASCPT